MSDLIIARAWGTSYMPDPNAFSEIVELCLQHRPWFDDLLWNGPADEKRTAVIGHLSKAFSTGRIWSVLREGACVGILLLEQVRPHRDALAHFIFFDRQLRNKKSLCEAAIRDSFERYDLEVLRIEVPTYAAKLANYAREALGFKYEGEWLGVPTDVAYRASRRTRAIRHKEQSHDLLLLALPREALDERPPDENR